MTGFASGGSGLIQVVAFVLLANSALAAATVAPSASRSTIEPASDFSAVSIPFNPTGCAAQLVCAQWCAAVPIGRVATYSSARGAEALTSPMSEDAVLP